MELSFATNKFKKLVEKDGKLRGEYGERMAEKIKIRLADLESAKCLEEFRSLPGRCHELTGNYEGCFALDLVHPKRLIFKPEGVAPKLENGAINWAEIKSVIIIEITDYH